MIQYTETAVVISSSLQYWMPRWSLPSGGVPRRPGGGA